jgi:O-antigen ligase
MTVRVAFYAAFLGAGTVAITLLVGVAGPLIALALAVALVGGGLILADTHWGFVALVGVAFVLPFAGLPFSIGFKPTFLDVALGALIFVWLIKLAIGQERLFVASPLGGVVALFLLLAIFSFLYGLTHSAANTFLLRRFVELLLGISLFFVVVNTVRTQDEVVWVTRWLMLAGWAAAAIAVLFYVIPDTWTVAVLDRLARFDYPGGYGALRYIEDDPLGTMRAIGTAIDPNVLGGMMILVAALAAPQLAAEVTVLPRPLVWAMMGTAVAALYLTYSRSALLGLAAVLALLALLKYRRLVWIGALGLILLFVLPQTQAYVARLLEGFAGQDLATQMRFGEYKDALTLIRRYPVFGVGFTGVPDIDLYLGVSMLYLILASNMGIVGLVAFVAVIASFFALVMHSWRKGFNPQLEPIVLGAAGAVAGALVSGIFDHYWFNLTYPHMTVLFWLYLGLATATILVQQSDVPQGEMVGQAQVDAPAALYSVRASRRVRST